MSIFTTLPSSRLRLAPMLETKAIPLPASTAEITASVLESTSRIFSLLRAKRCLVSTRSMLWRVPDVASRQIKECSLSFVRLTSFSAESG